MSIYLDVVDIVNNVYIENIVNIVGMKSINSQDFPSCQSTSNSQLQLTATSNANGSGNGNGNGAQGSGLKAQGSRLKASMGIYLDVVDIVNNVHIENMINIVSMKSNNSQDFPSCQSTSNSQLQLTATSNGNGSGNGSGNGAQGSRLKAQGSRLKASMEKNTQRRILSIWEEREERFLYLETDTPFLYLFPNRETSFLSL